MNRVLERNYDTVFLALELGKIFGFKKTFEEDKYKSIHLHNDMWYKITRMIKDEDEFRLKVAELIISSGVRNAEEKVEERRTITGTNTRRTKRTITGT